jgi:peptidyl-prolyl cis-trans isomerase SurA
MIRKTLLTLLVCFAIAGYGQKNIIDKVIAVVGSEPVLMSDLEAQYIQYLMQQGAYFEDASVRCDLFEELLIQKLLLNQAHQDSVVVSDKQVTGRIDSKMNYYIMQMGSKEKFEEYYGKTVDEFKSEFFEITRDQMMIEQVQRTLTENVKITPTQVKRFFREIPKDSLPTLPAEFEIGQIVKIPPVRPEAREATIAALNRIRERVLDGEDFATLAKLSSQDPGSASKGGEISFGRGMMDPVFEATAFALKNPGEISPVIESAFGYHIIRLVRRSGEFVTVRHILLIPEVNPRDLLAAEKDLNNIKALIEMDTISFEAAALKYSDDPSGKNGGRLVNPETGSSLFTRQELDPAVAHVVERLKTGELSKPVIMITDQGKQAFRLLYLYRKVDSHVIDLEQDYEKVRSYALQQQKMKVMDEWISSRIKETYIKIIDEDLQKCDFGYEW